MPLAKMLTNSSSRTQSVTSYICSQRDHQQGWKGVGGREEDVRIKNNQMNGVRFTAPENIATSHRYTYHNGGLKRGKREREGGGGAY